MVMSLNLHLAHIKIEVVESKEYAKEGKIDIGPEPGVLGPAAPPTWRTMGYHQKWKQ